MSRTNQLFRYVGLYVLIACLGTGQINASLFQWVQRFPSGGLTPIKILFSPDQTIYLYANGLDENYRNVNRLFMFDRSGNFLLKQSVPLGTSVVLTDVLLLPGGETLYVGQDENDFSGYVGIATGSQSAQRFPLQTPENRPLAVKSATIKDRSRVLLAGCLESPKGILEGRDGYLAFLDIPNQKVFHRVLGKPGIEEGLNSAVVLSDGRVVAGGYEYQDGQYNGWLVVLDSTLTRVLLEKQFPNGWVNRVFRMPDGGWGILGYRFSETQREKNAWFVVFDKNMQLRWEWQSSLWGDDEFRDGFVTVDRRLAFCGYATLSGSRKAIFMKFDWMTRQKLFQKPLSRFKSSVAQVLYELPTGRILMAGELPESHAGFILQEQGINKRAYPPQIFLAYQVLDANSNRKVEPGENYFLKIQIDNRGKTALKNGELVIQADDEGLGILEQQVILIGDIFPGQTRLVQRSFQAASYIQPGVSHIYLRVREMGNTYLERSVKIQKAPGRSLQISFNVFPGVVFPEDTTTVTLQIRNSSSFAAKDCRLKILSNHPAIKLMGDVDRSQLEIGSGEEISLEFRLFVAPTYTGPEKLPLVLYLQSRASNLSLRRPLDIRLEKAPTEMVVTSPPAVSPTAKQLAPIDVDMRLNPEIDIEANIPRIAKKDPLKFAVVIGNRDYRHGIAPVDYAIRDAFVFKEYLINMLGFDEGNVFFLPNATKSDFERFFGDERNVRGKLYNSIVPGKSDVIVFYSGHGAPGRSKDEDNYLVPVDADPNFLRMTGYPLNQFYQNISQIPARNILVIIDACFSGQVYQGISPIFVYVPPEERVAPHFIALTSTSETETSVWLEDKRHSLFTYLFLKGLQTFEADRNRDLKITIKEMYEYLTDPINLSHSIPYLARKLRNVEQRPSLFGKNVQFILVER
ncbi:MAG: caspase family protein [Calditrichaeota bacterium]|nr:caspase family protein [Calditrichota bacterium]